MRKSKSMALGTILLLLVSSQAFSQNERVDRATVAFSNPSQPGVVDATLMMGAIIVKGYSGKEVIVEARIRGTLLQEQEKDEIGFVYIQEKGNTGECYNNQDGNDYGYLIFHKLRLLNRPDKEALGLEH